MDANKIRGSDGRPRLAQEVGNWVSGERFWDREHEIATLTRLLREGAHVSLVAPRRVGKTSLMRELARRLDGEFTCLHVDLQVCSTPEDVVVELSLATRRHRSLWSRTMEVFRNVLSDVESLSADTIALRVRDGVAGDWRAKGNRLLEELASSDGALAVFVDELPILVNRLLRGPNHEVDPQGIARADSFLSWLRGATIRHRAAIRFVVAGSIGLEPVLRQGRLSATLNTFTPFELEPWDAETARGCLHALANHYGLLLEELASQRVVARLGCCVPHHVQLFWSHLHDDARRRRATAIDTDDVDRVYRRRMLSSRGHVELSHFEDRLRLVLGPRDWPFASDLLTEAAVAGTLTAASARRIADDFRQDGISGASDLRNVLGILEHDGYLRPVEDGFCFVSTLVRDWWKGRFEFGFVPVSERKPEEGNR